MWINLADPHLILNNSTAPTQFPKENPIYLLFTADNGDINPLVDTGLTVDYQYRINYLDN
jgi:hypothetical protein